MRTEQEILDDINGIRKQYHESYGEMTTTGIAEMNERLVELQQELSSTIAKGADPCECGNETFAPMGILKTPARNERGVDMPPVYEVGCVHCPPFLVEREDGYDVEISDGRKGKFKRRSKSARGFTPKDAVKNWNDKNWVEDNLFDRNIPGISDTAVQDENGVWHIG